MITFSVKIYYNLKVRSLKVFMVNQIQFIGLTIPSSTYLPDPGCLPMPAGKSIRVHDPVTAYTVVERECER